VQAQKPIPGLPDGYLNLIHVDDAAAIVVLAAALPPGSWNQRPLLNVTDGQPLLRRDYHQFLADWFAAPSPVFAPPGPHSTSQRGGSNKRVSNQRLMEILNPPLRYADFRKGLRQALSLETESQ
jgi:nucleoside-diphosphate-sugar epimerase